VCARLTLADVLARITTEYGPSFANVTEDKLRTHIGQGPEDDVEMDNVATQSDIKKTVSREELVKIVQ
jgi:hypothetical protein